MRRKARDASRKPPRSFLALAFRLSLCLFRTMNYQFDWSVLWSGQIRRMALARRMDHPCSFSCLGWLLAVVLGIVSGALRTAPLASATLACGTATSNSFATYPLLVWMFFWYFGMPPLLPDSSAEWLLDHRRRILGRCLRFGVYHGARFSEVIRAGIRSIPKTQLEAAVSTGLTVAQSFRLDPLSRLLCG